LPSALLHIGCDRFILPEHCTQFFLQQRTALLQFILIWIHLYFHRFDLGELLADLAAADLHIIYMLVCLTDMF
jgi:hypothetical protein